MNGTNSKCHNGDVWVFYPSPEKFIYKYDRENTHLKISQQYKLPYAKTNMNSNIRSRW